MGVDAFVWIKNLLRMGRSAAHLDAHQAARAQAAARSVRLRKPSQRFYRFDEIRARASGRALLWGPLSMAPRDSGQSPRTNKGVDPLSKGVD